MVVLKDLEYLLISWDKESTILYLDWNEKSEDIEEEEYKRSAIIFRDIILEHKGEIKIKLVLNNTQKFKYVITPSTQKFIAEQIMKPLFNHIEKMAIVLPNDSFYSALSTEQVVDEIINTEASPLKVSNFKSVKEAKEWLLHIDDQE